MFLTRGNHHHPEIWEDYFGQAEGRISVYGHAAEREGLAGWLAEAQISEHLPTAWGDISLVRAQLAMLREALKDPANQMFHFLSESCVPIRPWRDFCKSLELDGRSRFCRTTLEELRKMVPGKAGRIVDGPRLTEKTWNFATQWLTLNREGAELLLEDDLTELFSAMASPDEIYFATLLAMKGYPMETRVAATNSTWVKWVRNRAHPESLAEVTPQTAAELMASGQYFARKFPAGSNIADYGLHGLPSKSRHSTEQITLR